MTFINQYLAWISFWVFPWCCGFVQAQNDNLLIFQEALEAGKKAGAESNSQVSVGTTDIDEVIPGNQGADVAETEYHSDPQSIESAANNEAEDNEAAQSIRQGHFNRPRFVINPDADPLIDRSQAIEDNSEAIAGVIDDEYSDCSVKTQSSPGDTDTDQCHGYTRWDERHCQRSLEVRCERDNIGRGDKIRHEFPAFFGLLFHDAEGDSQGCDIHFFDHRTGPRQVIARFSESCSTCDPLNNPLQYSAVSGEACTRTWDYRLRDQLAPFYADMGVVESITFHLGADMFGIRRATIQVVENQGNKCKWVDHWDDSACQAVAVSTCAAIDDRCVEGQGMRVINGHEVERACWRYETRYRCLTEGVDEEPYCDELRDRGCNQVSSHCVASVDNACAEYENTFECPIGEAYKVEVLDCSGEIYCMDGNCFDSSHSPNDGLALAATHLVALETMADDFDAESLSVFKGGDKECSKAVAGFKNCCKGSGWGVDAGLAQCSQEEEELGFAREAGRCHRIGSYCAKRTFFGVCTSRHTVFCCFTSKLGRIIQEQGRVQLGIDWGTTGNPNCRGFTPAELQRIDFSLIDFSEFYADALNNLSPMDRAQLQEELKQSLQDRLDQGK